MWKTIQITEDEGIAICHEVQSLYKKHEHHSQDVHVKRGQRPYRREYNKGMNIVENMYNTNFIFIFSAVDEEWWSLNATAADPGPWGGKR